MYVTWNVAVSQFDWIIVDRAEYLVNEVVVGINSQVADHIVVRDKICDVSRIERVHRLRPSDTPIVAAVYENVVGRTVTMVGDADFVSSVRGCPLSIINGNWRCGGVEEPGGASIYAGANVNVCEWWNRCETGHVDVVESIRVLHWRNCKICVTACWRDADSPSWNAVGKR